MAAGPAPKGWAANGSKTTAYVLDVPPESTAVAFGYFVQGTGQMWVSGKKIDEVGPEVPSTNMNTSRARSLPKTPVNLGFN